MLFVRAIIALCALVALAAPQAHAEDPFYKGKRLILIINFAAGGPSAHGALKNVGCRSIVGAV